ncbi:hypothetical protein EDC01DRAFT_169203 [Geopyxis carbonaria]|nr:hypothetical protein EDC01DRAFT_169203 [Geopyxis carbonaria]
MARPRRSAKPALHSSDDDGDTVMVEEDEVAKPRRRAARTIISSDEDEPVAVEPPKGNGTGRTRMLMVAVEVPKPKVQTTIEGYFGLKATNSSPSIANRGSKKQNKASATKTSVKAESSTPSVFASAKKKAAKKPDPVSDYEDASDDDEYSDELDAVASESESEAGSSEVDDESDRDVKPKGKGKGKATPAVKGSKAKRESYKCIEKDCGLHIEEREGDLAPMSSLDLIFDDIISRVKAIEDFMGPKKYRKLRVATMCSGTESPLLALNMFSKAIKARGLGRLEIEHVFSCEIEPYKQAYIERNFKPPILFRDIKELGREKATTAYGALLTVPGDVDILIAGTSCVDFSNLNNRQKGIQAGGESGDTFLGMMAWVERHKPKIVIQENVKNAAWAEMRTYYHNSGYAAEYTHFDSKNYYIPHTRQRGYIMATPNEKSDIPAKWLDAVRKMKRPSTTTFEAFMLPDDDPRVYKARMELAGDERSGPVKARVVDWDKCEGRHQRERIKNNLGMKRPCTAWEEGGVCRLLDFMWQDWGQKQVDRVVDLMDINYLIAAQEGYDPMYKAGFWNLSQNVDRNTMGGKPMGITPCLTPHMIPFLCYRGGPMTGIETLHMQGLPIDELILTRESSQQIQDLAGNAMSSTVVGTCMLAAMILCDKILPVPSDDDVMDIDEEEVDLTLRISGDEDLVERKLDLSTVKSADLRGLLREAETSARLCICEGRTGITSSKLRVCTECEYTVCEKCGGRPSHVVPANQVNKQFSNRTSPLAFENKLKEVIPMRLKVEGINKSILNKFLEKNSDRLDTTDADTRDTWAEIVLAAVYGEFRFKSLLRQETWVAIYEHPAGRLELFLNPKKPHWRFFAVCSETEGQRSPKRKLCDAPLGRMFVSTNANILEGDWELNLPTECSFDITVEGIGEKVTAWKRDLGLTDEASIQAEVWNGLKFNVPDEAKDKLDRDISGNYKLLKDCGTAQSALHMKEENGDQPPLFFFLDQTRIDLGKDIFVFSENRRRLGYGESRTLVAQLPPKWRQFSSDKVQQVECTVKGAWVPIKSAELLPSTTGETGVVASPGPGGLTFDASNDACKTATSLLICKAPLEKQAERVWPRGKWVEVDNIHERLTYESLAWLTERIRSMKHLGTWKTLPLPSKFENCERCAPTAPSLKWVMVKKRYIALEDSKEAAPYERALKNRPAALVTHLHLDDDNIGTLRIGLNVPSLVHRALARLQTERREQPPMLSWRLVTDYIPETTLSLPLFELTSNKKDAGHAQPPNFITKLRPEQLRSLSWMVSQEGEDVIPFIEEEVEESLLPHLNWRAEGRAERPNLVRGGVLADQVGYGKTAISIGLIDCTQDSIQLEKSMPGAIPVKATIIIVPGHLTNQWPSEVRKFTGGRYKVLEIKNQNMLSKITAKDIIAADIVIVSSQLFSSDAYLLNISSFSGTRRAPSSEGRRFEDWQKTALAALADQVDCLRDLGAAEVRKRIDKSFTRLSKEEAQEAFVQKKRAIGSAYIAEKENAGVKRKRLPDSSSDEESGSSESDNKVKKNSAKIKSRLEGDPWRLKTNPCKVNPMNMFSPPLEMFHFNRVIVDEFTYLKGQVHAGITSLKSSNRWVLSGTPPLDDFADVKTIAIFLDLNLGIDDDMGVIKRNKTRIRKDRTGVEQFTSFKEIHSNHWHKRRHEVAQAFLNQFVRQNIAEIDEIPSHEHLVPISLPAAERAIYLELEHYLQALDYNMQKSRAKIDNDRDRRQQEALGDSKTAEEALIKRCSHFDLDQDRKDEENAVQACDVIVEDRKRQLESCREDLRRSLKDAMKRYGEIPKSAWVDGPKDLWKEFVDISRSQGVGDPAANHDIKVLLDEAHSNGKPVKVVYVDGTVANPIISKPPRPLPKLKKAGKKKAEDEPVEVPWPTSTPEAITALKEKVFYIRTLARKELTGRHRSLRYFSIVRDLQKFGLHRAGENGQITDISCTCGKKNLPLSEVAVLSSCGHQGCFKCLDQAARLATCLTVDCEAATRALAVVKADSLGTEDKTDGIGRHHGRKLEKLMELINDRIPKDEKVLLFVQFPDLLEKVAKVLAEYKVSFLQIKGSAAKQGDTVQKFQGSTGEKGPKVLLLNVMQQSSSGSNFTNANHVILLSPLLTETEYEYKSSETQAIGRVLRYGQTRPVHIWRLLTEDTMDVEVFEMRTKKKREDWGDQVYQL